MSKLNWAGDGGEWPNRDASRFVTAAGLQWHIQEMGSGPTMLLVHGTGASTHSWRAFAPLLASQYRILACDLPGHGFTDAPRQHLTLPYMAHALTGLLEVLAMRPVIAIGHSAGAAILCRMALDQALGNAPIMSLNGALLPFGGFASQLFPALARALFLNPFVPSFLAWRAHDGQTVQRLITGTGSEIGPEGLALYARLFQDSKHVASALGMMANWDLDALAQGLPALHNALALFAATNDRAIPPDVAFKVQKRVPGSEVILLRGMGHLAHEEKPREVSELVLAEARRLGIAAADAPAS